MPIEVANSLWHCALDQADYRIVVLGHGNTFSLPSSRLGISALVLPPLRPELCLSNSAHISDQAYIFYSLTGPIVIGT